VAAALHFKALCAGERSVYTCPIKALVNEKFLALCRDFGPENVGMMTGDAS
jgi:superfamily II RNA helicase